MDICADCRSQAIVLTCSSCKKEICEKCIYKHYNPAHNIEKLKNYLHKFFSIKEENINKHLTHIEKLRSSKSSLESLANILDKDQGQLLNIITDRINNLGKYIVNLDSAPKAIATLKKDLQDNTIANIVKAFESVGKIETELVIPEPPSELEANIVSAIKELKNKCDDYKNIEKVHILEIDELKYHMNYLSDTNNDFEMTIYNNMRIIKEITDSNKELKNEVMALEAAKLKADADNKKLNNENSTYKKSIDEHQSTIAQLQREIVELENIVKMLEMNNATCVESLEELKSTVSRLEKSNVELTEQNVVYKNQINKLDIELKEKDKQLDNAKEINSQLQDKFKEMLTFYEVKINTGVEINKDENQAKNSAKKIG